MNITMLAEYFLPRLGGVEVLVDDLARVLGQRGHRVRVVTTTPADREAQGSRIPTVTGHGTSDANVTRVPAWELPAVGVPISPSLPFRLRRALAESPTDVVHVHASVGSLGALAGAWAAHALGLPMVLTLHSVLGRDAWAHRWSHALTGWGSWPQVVAGVSRPVADELAGAIGRATTVLPNGLDTAWWSEGREANPARPGRPLELITIQRMKRRKRGMALLEIVARAAAALSPAAPPRITFIGDGPRRSAMEARASALGVEAGFLGALDRASVKEALQRADAFLLASRQEAFGLAAAEARAVGLPVIAYRSGALPELVEHEETGLLGNSDDDLVHAVVRLARDSELLQSLSERSAAAPPHCDWSTVAELHEQAYARAVKNG